VGKKVSDSYSFKNCFSLESKTKDSPSEELSHLAAKVEKIAFSEVFNMQNNDLMSVIERAYSVCQLHSPSFPGPFATRDSMS